MRTIISWIFVLALVLTWLANPNGEVKSSPLFRQSLKESIAKLEGNIEQRTNGQAEQVQMPTGKLVCPMSEITALAHLLRDL